MMFSNMYILKSFCSFTYLYVSILETQMRVTEQTLKCDERIKKIENFIAKQSKYRR